MNRGTLKLFIAGLFRVGSCELVDRPWSDNRIHENTRNNTKGTAAPPNVEVHRLLRMRAAQPPPPASLIFSFVLLFTRVVVWR